MEEKNTTPFFKKGFWYKCIEKMRCKGAMFVTDTVYLCTEDNTLTDTSGYSLLFDNVADYDVKEHFRLATSNEIPENKKPRRIQVGDIVRNKNGMAFSNGEKKLTVVKIEEKEGYEYRWIWMSSGTWTTECELEVVDDEVELTQFERHLMEIVNNFLTTETPKLMSPSAAKTYGEFLLIIARAQIAHELLNYSRTDIK